MNKKYLSIVSNVDLKYLIFIFFHIFIFYKSLYNSISISIETGSWRLFLIPFAIIIFREESKAPLQLLKSRFSFVLYGLFIFAALCIQYLGRWAGLNIFYEVAIILALISSLILFTGLKGIVKYKWTLFYLLFMTSVTDEIVLPLQFFLRMIATKAVVLLMPLFGYPIISDGTNIRLSHIVMNIAAECSGLNQFMSLLIISIPLSIMLIKNSYLRVFAVFCSFPLAIFSNVLRLLIIGIWNYKRYEFSHGPHSLFAMSSIFMIGLILLYVLCLLISKYELRYGKKTFSHKKDNSKINDIITLKFKSLFIIMTIAFLGWLLFIIRSPEQNLELDLIDKQYQVEGWDIIDDTLEVFSNHDLPEKYRINRMLIDSDSNIVLLEINHYPYQDSERNMELTTYPVLRFLYDSKIRIDNQNGNFNYSFGYNEIQNKYADKKATAVLYLVNKKITGSRTLAKIEIIRNLIFFNKNRGSLIAITLINKGNKADDDFIILEEIISELIR